MTPPYEGPTPLKKTATAQETILVTAATVTAELNGVNEIAKDMTLGVMNAKTISHRAGETAKGFQPITDYIEQVARDVSQAVVRISQDASVLSQLAVSYHHHGKILKAYQTVSQDAGDAAYASSLLPVIGKLDQQAEDDRNRFVRSLEALIFQLNEMKNSIRSSKVISTVSRVEAAASQAFRKSLEVVADDLEASTEKIRTRVLRCNQQLTTVMEQIEREVVS